MKNLKLQWNSIKRNKTQFLFLVLSALIYLGLSSYALIRGVTANAVIYEFTGFFLMQLPMWVLFYIYITLETCYEIQNYKEAYCLTKKGMASIYKTQFSIIMLHVMFSTLLALFSNVLYIFISKQADFNLILHTVFLILFYFFLCCTAAAFIGLALSQIRKKHFSQTIFILIAASELPIANNFANGFYTLLGVDLFNLIKLLSLPPNSILGQQIHQAGFEIADDKISHLLFLITLSILIITILQSRKKTAKCAICIALCISMLVSYLMPYASFKSETSEYAVVDYLFSDKLTQITEAADFNVKKYDMKFSAFRKLKADVKIHIDKSDLSEYKFTLYHGYKIKEIANQNGDKLDFEQNGDYFTVHGDGRVEFLNVKYSGYCKKFYTTYKNVFLPANFAYYPVPGFREVFSEETGASFVDMVLPAETEFNVEFDLSKRIVSNLNEISKNKFEGKGKSLTLLGGYTKEAQINGTTVYYPYFDSKLNEASITRHIGEFTKNHPELKKIILIPNTNLSGYERCRVYDNYMLLSFIYDVENSYYQSLIPPEKKSLNSWLRRVYQYGAEGYEHYKERNLSDTERKEFELTWEIMSNDSSGEKKKKIEQYLINNNDTRTPIEFLESIR